MENNEDEEIHIFKDMNLFLHFAKNIPQERLLSLFSYKNSRYVVELKRIARALKTEIKKDGEIIFQGNINFRRVQEKIVKENASFKEALLYILQNSDISDGTMEVDGTLVEKISSFFNTEELKKLTDLSFYR